MRKEPTYQNKSYAKGSYQAFLLRIWFEPGPSHDGSPTWRFSLEHARGGERLGFASPDQLAKYLQEKIKEANL